MVEQSLKVEYLVIVDTSNSFCASEEAFNNLFRTNSKLTLRNGKMKYKNLEVEYKVQTKNLETQESRLENKRFFHIHLICSDVSKIDVFEELLRVVRDLLHKASEVHQTLWDDISFYYSRRAYPQIHEIENLMRKLITKFMLTNVGLAWTKDNIPEEVKNSVRSSKKDEKADYLYKTDFIQLANFLFEEYSPLAVTSLFEKLKKTTNIDDISLSDLKDFVPKSNWEKYFSAIVECDAEYLQKRWEKLYNLRNQIAHNSSLRRSDYEEVLKIVEELKKELEKAIKGLDKIHVSNEDKEVVAENLASGTNEAFLGFLNEYKFLEKILFSLASKLGDNSHKPLNGIKILKDRGIINSNTAKEIKNLQAIRNLIVHSSSFSPNQDDINEWTKRCTKLNDYLYINLFQDLEEDNLMEKKKDNQEDIVKDF